MSDDLEGAEGAALAASLAAAGLLAMQWFLLKGPLTNEDERILSLNRYWHFSCLTTQSFH